MRGFVVGALACFALAGSTAVEAKKAPELTPMEIQALQSHEFETTKDVLFASVVSVFQDLGYQLENADGGSGFITASSATKNKTSIWDALAKQSASGNTRVTAFVEAMPNGMSRVRLNFLNSKVSSGMWGQSSKQDKAILDPQTYKAAWDKIDEAIFVRSATNAPARQASSPVAAPSSAPSAAGAPVAAQPNPTQAAASAAQPK